MIFSNTNVTYVKCNETLTSTEVRFGPVESPLRNAFFANVTELPIHTFLVTMPMFA